jgi:hypothetical protein
MSENQSLRFLEVCLRDDLVGRDTGSRRKELCYQQWRPLLMFCAYQEVVTAATTNYTI